MRGWIPRLIPCSKDPVWKPKPELEMLPGVPALPRAALAHLVPVGLDRGTLFLDKWPQGACLALGMEGGTLWSPSK